MSQMSRAQRMLLVYILFKLSQPRVIQEINKFYGAGGGISQIQEASDVDTGAIGDDKILVYKTSSSKHEYEAKPTGYTDAEAVAAVEAEDPLDLAGDIAGAKSGGITITGGTGSGDDLTLHSTSHATKGQIVCKDDVIVEGATKTVLLRAGNISNRDALLIMNSSGTAYRDLKTEYFYSNRWYALGNPSKLLPWANRGIQLTDNVGIVIAEWGDGSFGEFLTIYKGGDHTFLDGKNIIVDTTTGTKIGTATTQKLGFFNATPVVQQSHIADADGTLADITTKFNTLLSYVEALGFLALV